MTSSLTCSLPTSVRFTRRCLDYEISSVSAFMGSRVRALVHLPCHDDYEERRCATYTWQLHSVCLVHMYCPFASLCLLLLLQLFYYEWSCQLTRPLQFIVVVKFNFYFFYNSICYFRIRSHVRCSYSDVYWHFRNGIADGNDEWFTVVWNVERLGEKGGRVNSEVGRRSGDT